MEKTNPIALIIATDLRRILSSTRPKDPKKSMVSLLLFGILAAPFALFAFSGGALLAVAEDPLLPIRGIFVFTAISSFILSLLLFVGLNSNKEELAFLLLTPAKRSQVIIAKLVSTSITLGFFYVAMFLIFAVYFSMGTDPVYLFTGLGAFILVLFVSFTLANFCSMVILKFFITSSNKRTLKVLGLGFIVLMILAMRSVMTASTKYLSFSKFVPPAYGADLMLLRTPGAFFLIPYLLLIPIGIWLSIKASQKFWAFSEPTVIKERKASRAPSPAFEEPTFLIAQKEVRMILREPEVLLRVLLMFVFLAIWPFLSSFMPGNFTLIALPMFFVFEGVIISLVINPNALGTEARTLWILKASPLKAYDLFFGKWFLAAASCGGMFFLILIFYLLFGWIEPSSAVLLALLVFEISIIIPALGIGIGFNFPDFERAKKNRPGISTVAAMYAAGVVVFLPAMVSLTYTFSAARPVTDILFYNALGLGISALVGGVAAFRLYRKMEGIYEDLETVDGASFLT